MGDSDEINKCGFDIGYISQQILSPPPESSGGLSFSRRKQSSLTPSQTSITLTDIVKQQPLGVDVRPLVNCEDVQPNLLKIK